MVHFNAVLFLGLAAASVQGAPLKFHKRIAQVIADSTAKWEKACLAAGGDQQCNPISVTAFSTLLAAAGPCEQQDAADSMIDLAKTLKNDPTMITLAQIFAQQPRNTPNSQSVPYCQQAPKNGELDGLFQCQFQGASAKVFVGGVAVGQPGTIPFGSKAALSPAGSCPANPDGPIADGTQLVDIAGVQPGSTGETGNNNESTGGDSTSVSAAPSATTTKAAPTTPVATSAAPAGTQFITGVCSSDADCASSCCGFNSGKCAGPVIAQERDGGCGFGDPEPNNKAAVAIQGPNAEKPSGARTSVTVAPAATTTKAAPTTKAATSAAPAGTQFITGVCSSDADCASSCCGFKSGKCAGPVIAQERDGGCGFGDSEPNNTAAVAIQGPNAEKASGVQSSTNNNAAGAAPAPAPAATQSAAASSPASGFKLQNGKDAQALNAKFASLSASSSCTSGDEACIDGGFAQCVNGQFVVQSCGATLTCAALPLVNKAGTSITCTTQADAEARIAATGAGGGFTGA